MVRSRASELPSNAENLTSFKKRIALSSPIYLHMRGASLGRTSVAGVIVLSTIARGDMKQHHQAMATVAVVQDGAIGQARILDWVRAKARKKATKFRKKAAELHADTVRRMAAVARRILSPGEFASLEGFRTELIISWHHRAGLRKIRRESLGRPEKLNLGCGPFSKRGFLNVDLFPGGDVTLDLRRGLPFESGCCGFIFSEHFFEHIDHPEPITSLFRECLRVLRPGGELRFSVPDTKWPLTEYQQGPESPYFKACAVHGWHPKDCVTRLEHINYHFRQQAEHRYAYDFETAEKTLAAAGFADIRESAFEGSLDSEHRRVGSLFVSARKAA